MTRRWQLGGPLDYRGLAVWVDKGSHGEGDLLLKISTGERWLVPKACHIALLADYLADNEAHNRAGESGAGYTREYLDIACRLGVEAAEQWDKDRRRDGR